MPGSVRVVVDEEAQGRHDLAGAAFPVEVERAGAVVEEQVGGLPVPARSLRSTCGLGVMSFAMATKYLP